MSGTYNDFPREVFLMITTWMWVRIFQHGFKKNVERGASGNH